MVMLNVNHRDPYLAEGKLSKARMIIGSGLHFTAVYTRAQGKAYAFNINNRLP